MTLSLYSKWSKNRKGLIVMTDNLQKEELSIAYINAICAKAKIKFDMVRRDEDGVDATIRKDVNAVSAIFGIQLKSTTVKGVSKGFTNADSENFTYPLKIKNYNDLIGKSTYPRLLMLLVLPENEDEWFLQDTENLIMRKCMYYKNLFNESSSNNSETVNIEISKQDICSPQNLEKLFSDYVEELLL